MSNNQNNLASVVSPCRKYLHTNRNTMLAVVHLPTYRKRCRLFQSTSN